MSIRKAEKSIAYSGRKGLAFGYTCSWLHEARREGAIDSGDCHEEAALVVYGESRCDYHARMETQRNMQEARFYSIGRELNAEQAENLRRFLAATDN